MKLLNLHITPKLVKKVITNLDLSKVSGPDCISMMVPKKCVSLKFRTNQLNSLTQPCFLTCLKALFVAPVFKNAGKQSMAKQQISVSLLSVISQVLEKLVNNSIVDNFKK